MKKFTFTVTTETTECFTVTWKINPPPAIRQDDYDSGVRTKDFMTEIEARKFAENLKHEPGIGIIDYDEIHCEYRKIIDLTKPKITYRNTTPGEQ